MDAIADPKPHALAYAAPDAPRPPSARRDVSLLALAVVTATIAVAWRVPYNASPTLEAADSWRHGWIPLLANDNADAFAPTIIPLLIVPGLHAAWIVRTAMALAIAAWGAWRWGGNRLPPRHRLLLSIAFTLALALLGLWRNATRDALIWLPWCACAIASLANAITIPRVLGAALAFAMSLLAGDFWAFGAVVALTLLSLAFQPGMRPTLAVLTSVATILLALALGAFASLPLWDRHVHPSRRLPLPGVKDALVTRIAAKAEWCKDRGDAYDHCHGPSYPGDIVYLDTEIPDDLRDWADRVKVQTKPPTGALARIAAGSPPKLESCTAVLGHWQAHVSAGGIAWLVVRVPYDPGWTARIVRADQFGRQSADAIVLPADGHFCAVPTDGQGPADVLLEYHPLAFRRGAMISGASAMLLLVLLTIHLGFRRSTV